MIVYVWHPGFIQWLDGRTRDPVRCALGKGGIAREKREGDGATPAGVFPLRRVFYRPDRVAKPETRLPVHRLHPHDGWCDDAGHAAYNTMIRRPCSAHHERLWRRDSLYDVIVEVGYNDAPVVGGLGSAIFLHVARAGYRATEGCVALALDDLLELLKRCGPETRITIGDKPR
jgi:L,D-peptidoglycan transpeptidase YkuD (ErfK/YbiS/YcfS/YnhG family)